VRGGSTWAPDGKRIAFVRAEEHNPRVWNLWLLSSESGDMRQLTSTLRAAVERLVVPGRSPHRLHARGQIVVLDLADGRTREFSSPVAGHLVRTPVVSPDGTKIIFQVHRQGAWLLNVADGSMLCALTDGTAEEFAWAPDGRRVAFHSRRDGEWGIYVMAK
jgi:Tol biopolymer transport system component